VDGAEISNESMVNLPNWLVLRFRVDDGDWFQADDADLDDYRLELDMRRGVLTRHLRVALPGGRGLLVTQRRFVHLVDPQLAALETTFLLDGSDASLTVQAAVDAAVRNQGVERYRALADQHLRMCAVEEVDSGIALVAVETNQSHVRIAEAHRTRLHHDGGYEQVSGERRWLDEDGLVGHELTVDLRDGVPVTIEKVVAIVTASDPAIAEPAESAVRKVRRAPFRRTPADPRRQVGPVLGAVRGPLR
jgi:trehalose/maltose hydrolase-like predicted phosphorylase